MVKYTYSKLKTNKLICSLEDVIKKKSSDID